MDEVGIQPGEWVNQTTVHPVGLVAVILLGLSAVVLPRRYAVVPFLVMACFVPPAQRFVIFTLDFDFLRVMTVFGWFRVLVRGEAKGLTWLGLDKAILMWVGVKVLAYSITHGSVGAIVYILGWGFDAVGMYFLFRHFVRNWDDFDHIASQFTILSVPVAIAFLVEKSTGRNVFAALGGVPEFTVIREGRLRCQGAFAHPILAGCFWAAVIPWIASRYWNGRASTPAVVIGIVSALTIVFLCASSTPVSGLICVVVGVFALPLRNSMRIVRRCVFLALCFLHFIMKHGVWSLFARIDIVGGSTGWFRYFLIDQTIRHFGEWWLIGTQSTAHWGAGLFDVTNQYVLEGVGGGLAALILFVVVLSRAFAYAGRVRALVEADSYLRMAAWLIGVSVFVHMMCFFAVSYFGQIILLWYLTLAVCASLYEQFLKANRETTETAELHSTDLELTFANANTA